MAKRKNLKVNEPVLVRGTNKYYFLELRKDFKGEYYYKVSESKQRQLRRVKGIRLSTFDTKKKALEFIKTDPKKMSWLQL